MLYKHYKGGIYFLVAWAMPPKPGQSVFDEGLEYFVTAKAIDGDEIWDVDVATFKHEQTGFRGYVAFCDRIEETHCLYKGLDGRYWLRPKDEFYELLPDGRKRFDLLTETKVFEILTEYSRS